MTTKNNNSCFSAIKKLALVFFGVLILAYVVVTYIGPRLVDTPVETASAAPEGNCPATREQLIGNWFYVSGFGFFQEFELTKEGTFSSWNEGRSDMSAVPWTYENCSVVTTPEVGIMNQFELKILDLSGDELRILNVDENGEGIYRKIK